MNKKTNASTANDQISSEPPSQLVKDMPDHMRFADEFENFLWSNVQPVDEKDPTKSDPIESPFSEPFYELMESCGTRLYDGKPRKKQPKHTCGRTR